MLILYFLLFVIIGLLNSNSKFEELCCRIALSEGHFEDGFEDASDDAATILSTIFNTNVVFLSTLIPPSAILMLYSFQHYCEFYSTLLINLIQFLFYILFQILILFHKFQCFIVIFIEFFSSYCFYFFNYFWIFIII